MSLRAIKKRESQQPQTPNYIASTTTKPTLFKKSATTTTATVNTRKYTNNSANLNAHTSPLSAVQILEQQRVLLGRATRSNPDIRKTNDTLQLLVQHNKRLLRTKSDTDVNTLLRQGANNAQTGAAVGLSNAKSEVCLQTISVHDTVGYTGGVATNSKPYAGQARTQMSQSTLVAGTDGNTPLTSRRLSECSLMSAYSQRTSAISGSALTLSQDNSSRHSSVSYANASNAAVRVPIIGYEVMEERARFTVYKLRVENPYSNDCWLVLRRYTDFVRLHTKLKQAYPHITLMLPRKKIFGDNFNTVFLDNRVQGLQLFVNAIMAREELRKCKMVREFFCLDEPPMYSESMEECRAIFEAQEETIAHLKMQVNNKNDLILNLQQKLREELLEKEQLKETLRNLSLNCPTCGNSSSKVGNAMPKPQ